MPLLSSLIVGLFGAIASFFAQWLTKKIAVGLAAVATLAALTGGLLAFMRGVIEPIAANLIPAQFANFIGLAFPPIAPLCITALVTTWAACALYTWQKEALALFLKA